MAMHSDPMFNKAFGAIRPEWVQTAARARLICTADDESWANEQRRRFTGVCRCLLTDTSEKTAVEITGRERTKYQLRDPGSPGESRAFLLQMCFS